MTTLDIPAAPPSARAAGHLHRRRLDNGLRVVVLPDQGVPAVGVAVIYDVGYRTEARSGFAHLFEHLMFQGSANLPKLAHAQHIQANGGAFNGTTHRDHTGYYQVLPAEMLEVGLFLESDRMRGLRITAENLANQVGVVTEEIRRNVLNQPYGGFPLFLLPPVLFDSFANTHDGYGDFESLGAATVEECTDFFDTYYSPGNAVLAICGMVDPAAALELAERHFGDLPGRAVPPAQSLAEPALPAARVGERHDPLAPVPALALGWRMPPPGSPEYLATVVAAAVLGDGDVSRLRRELVQERRLASQLLVQPGLAGAAFESRDPDALVISAVHSAEVPSADVAGAILGELDRLARDGLGETECGRALRRLEGAWYRDIDAVGARVRRLGTLELLHGDGELVLDGPRRLASAGPDDVQAAAAALVAQHHATLRVIPDCGRR